MFTENLKIISLRDAMLLNKLEHLISCPKWLIDNTQYLTLMGSHAYGTNTKDSDFDVYGFAIPPKEMVFPHLSGEIFGFGRQTKRFDVWQQHHIMLDKQEYDFSVYGIVAYFQLLMENNPNIIDSIFTPQNCILHITSVGNIVRENRKKFLHKGSYHKFKGYAFSQLHKASSNKQQSSNRRELCEKFGFDTKFCSHVVRLACEIEMILEEGDLDLQRNNEQMKAVRRGEVPFEEVKKWFNDKERHLASLYEKSSLQYKPNEEEIKQILLKCLEHHYGNLDKCINNLSKDSIILTQIRELLCQ